MGKIPNTTCSYWELEREVVNPHPDKRHAYDWKKHAVWPKGMRFAVETRPLDFTEADSRLVRFIRRVRLPSDIGKRVFGECHEKEETFPLVMAAAVTRVPTFRELMEYHGVTDDDIIRHLFKNCTVDEINDMLAVIAKQAED